jgi:hypothetical protein
VILRDDFPRDLAVLGTLSRATAGRPRRCLKSIRKVFRKSGASESASGAVAQRSSLRRKGKIKKVEGRISAADAAMFDV